MDEDFVPGRWVERVLSATGCRTRPALITRLSPPGLTAHALGSKTRRQTAKKEAAMSTNYDPFNLLDERDYGGARPPMGSPDTRRPQSGLHVRSPTRGAKAEALTT